MTAKLELDIGQLYAAMSAGSLLRGDEVLGPRESALGSALHEFVKVDSNLVLEIQKLSFREPWAIHVVRRNSVAFQFTSKGSFRRELENNVSIITPSTVTIASSSEAIVNATLRDRELQGIGVYVDKEYVIKVLGLNVTSTREPYRSMFTSHHGVPILFAVRADTADRISRRSNS